MDFTEVNSPQFKDAQQYLIDRGFDLRTIDDHGIKIVAKPSLRRLFSATLLDRYVDGAHGILLPHMTIDGKESGYVTARMIGKGKSVGFNPAAEPPPKLICPGKKLPRVHFPLANPDLDSVDRVYLCESRLKADVVAMNGCFAIGFNGCWGFTAARTHNVELLAELEDEIYGDKELVIFFDSNTDKLEVKTAVSRLSSLLKQRGRKVTQLVLPKDPEGNDWGVDDYFVHHGAEELQDYLAEETHEAPKDLYWEGMHQLNDEVAYCHELARYINLKTGNVHTKGEIENTFAPRIVWREGKPVSLIKHWNSWDKRTEVENIDYLPGEPMIVNGIYNTWRGPGIEPVPGPVTRFKQFMELAYPAENEREYILDWIAYMIQNPGAKLATSIIQYGEEGTGKSTLAVVMRRMLGKKNAYQIQGEALNEAYNGHFVQSQFLCFEEVSIGAAHESKRVLNKLKTFITEEEVTVKTKYVPEYVIGNHFNVMINTNEFRSVGFSRGDRRFFVAEIASIGDEDPRGHPSYWNKLYKWLNRDISIAYLLHWFGERDLSGFDPAAPAPMTEIKQDMAEQNMSVEQYLAHMLMDKCDEIEALLGRPIGRFIHPKWVLTHYCEKMDYRLPMKDQSFSHALKRAGARKPKIEVITVNGENRRIWDLEPHLPFNRDQAVEDLEAYMKPRTGSQKY